MRAAVMRGPGLLSLEDVDDPVCPRGGALAMVDACSVCGTDVKMLERGHRDLTYPRVLGHEVVGTVVEVDGDAPVKEGDQVQLWPGIACGRCLACRKGWDNQCRFVKIFGFNMDGGFCEMMALPPVSLARGANVLGRGLDPAQIALAEPLACCINGQEKAEVAKGDFVLIVGGGPLGCLHAVLARARGANSVLISERLEARRSLVERQGIADRVIDASGEVLKRAVYEEGWEDGADVVLLAAPGVEVAPFLDLLAPGGRICAFSGPALGSVPLRPIHYRDLKVVGSYGCSSRQDKEAVEMISSGLVDLGWLITMRTPLEGIEDALDHASRRDGMRSTIEF